MKSTALAFMVPGGILVAFGIVDLVGSFVGFDLWGTIGVPLPDIVWRFSAYIEIAVGGYVFNLGRQQNEVAAVAE